MVERLTRMSRVREFDSQRPGKSYTALQTIRHRFNIYASSVAALPWRYNAEMGTANSVLVSA